MKISPNDELGGIFIIEKRAKGRQLLDDLS